MTDTTRGQAANPDEEQLFREFDAAWERGLDRRVRYSFIRTYKPVLDDAGFRAWATTAEHRAWCDRHLPEWLGYGNG